MRRFFVPLSAIHGQKVSITGSDAHHLLHVLRKKIGDTFEATDGQNRRLILVIRSLSKDKVVCSIQKTYSLQERTLSVRLFQAIPKTSAWEQIITMACELGVNEVFPVLSDRTIYPHDMVGTIKPRWLRIAEETAKKTGRLSTMIIHPILTWKDIPSHLEESSLKIMPWEGEKETSLRALLEPHQSPKTVELLLGPEGGFSLQEAEEATSWGFHTVSLGERVLTTATAVITTLANIYYSLDRFENSHPQ
ncbi:MAG: RsmE family RNA methyltransferase [Brevinematales bacterium]